jgi:putative nucleotidyltransferase with HDIG domain
MTKRLRKSLKKTPFFEDLNRLAQKKGQRIYLVGGYLRDLIMHRSSQDIDFCVTARASDLAHKFAESMKDKFFFLDDLCGTARVIHKDVDKVWELDFTNMRGGSIASDLAKRDFTIDALAMDLALLGNPRIIDPCGGLEDLRRGTVRAIGEGVFEDDPLRLLRAVRLEAILGFRMDHKTQRLVPYYSGLLPRVSAERIRDELFWIFASPQSHKHIDRLDKLGLLTKIIPEVESLRGVGQPRLPSPSAQAHGGQEGFHHLPVWAHSLATLKHIDQILNDLEVFFPKFHSRIATHLEEVIADRQTRATLLKFSSLLHDIGKPPTQEVTPAGKVRFIGHEALGVDMVTKISERLRMSNRSIQIIGRVIINHMRPGNLSHAKELTKRAIYRFFRDTDKEGVEVLLLSYADGLATQGPLTTHQLRARHKEVVLKMLASLYEETHVSQPPKLIDGKDLMAALSLPPGPIIGDLLNTVREAQAEGKVKNRAQALKFAREQLQSCSILWHRNFNMS